MPARPRGSPRLLHELKGTSANFRVVGSRHLVDRRMPTSTIGAGGQPLPDTKSEIGLGKRLRLAHMAFSRALRLELAKEDVTFGQFVHLERLWEEDGLTQTELSRRVGVETASSTTILDELERLGFVERRRNSSDRRNINVFLTPAGSGLRPRLLDRASIVNVTAKQGMSAQEIKVLFSALDRIADALSSEYPQTGRSSGKDRLQA